MSDKLKVKIISRDEALKLMSKWPADVSFSEKFAQLHALRYGFKGGYVVATYSNYRLLFPVQWGNDSVFSVHKGHTMPYKIGAGLADPEWHDIVAEVLKITGCNLYIADFVVPESMVRGLKPLPLAVFILDTSQHNIDSIFSTFNKTTRNLVRRSQEQGFRIEIISGKMPDECYSLYVHHQRNKGTPPRPKEYFDDVARAFEDGFVIIGAYDKNRLVGMNLALCADRGLWLSINSSVTEYAYKHVNYLIYYEMIKWVCEHNIDRIDFGGSSILDNNIHNSFKLGFRASMLPLYRLTAGTIPAIIKDKFMQKKRAVHIRFKKLSRLLIRKF